MKQIPPSIYKFLKLACLKSSAPVAEETKCFQTLNITMADTAKHLSQVRLTRSLLPGELLRNDQRTKKAVFRCSSLCVYVCVSAHMCMVMSVHVCVHICMVMSVRVHMVMSVCVCFCAHGHSHECVCMCVHICMVVNVHVCTHVHGCECTCVCTCTWS